MIVLVKSATNMKLPASLILQLKVSSELISFFVRFAKDGVEMLTECQTFWIQSNAYRA